MIIDCKTPESIMSVISNNKYCVLLVGKRGCNQCEGLLPMLQHVYESYPFVACIFAPEHVASQYTKPYVAYSMSTIFIKDGLKYTQIKHSRNVKAYTSRVKAMIEE